MPKLPPETDDDVISFLKKDQTKIKGLFDQFEKPDNLQEKRKIVAKAIIQLKIDIALEAALEAEIFPIASHKFIGKKLKNKLNLENNMAQTISNELEKID